MFEIQMFLCLTLWMSTMTLKGTEGYWQWILSKCVFDCKKKQKTCFSALETLSNRDPQSLLRCESVGGIVL